MAEEAKKSHFCNPGSIHLQDADAVWIQSCSWMVGGGALVNSAFMVFPFQSNYEELTLPKIIQPNDIGKHNRGCGNHFNLKINLYYLVAQSIWAGRPECDCRQGLYRIQTGYGVQPPLPPIQRYSEPRHKVELKNPLNTLVYYVILLADEQIIIQKSERDLQESLLIL